ncbi:MAG: hypothetical protein AAF483_23905 [Planctomycetota bacterium]
MEVELVLPQQPLHDVDEILYSIFEDLGCGDVPSSGTFGNKDGIVCHDFQIIVPDLKVLHRVMAKLASSGINTEGGAISIQGNEHDFDRFVHDNC